MKITNVQAIGLKLPEISSAADGTQDDLIIIVETDEGITGYGEVDTAPGPGKAIIDAYMSHGTCYGLREVVVGCDPFDYEQIWNDMWAKTYYYGRSGPVMHVMSGIDMAIWDIMGKATGKPGRRTPDSAVEKDRISIRNRTRKIPRTKYLTHSAAERNSSWKSWKPSSLLPGGGSGEGC